MEEKVKSRIHQILTGFSTRFVIGLSVVLLSFAYFFYDLHLAYKYGRELGSDMKLALVGLLTLVLTWFFSSSKNESDKAKTEQVKELSNTTTTTTTTNP